MLNEEQVKRLATPEGIDEAVEIFQKQIEDLTSTVFSISASANYFIRNYNELVKAIEIKYPDDAKLLITASKLSAVHNFFKKKEEENG